MPLHKINQSAVPICVDTFKIIVILEFATKYETNVQKHS